MLSQSPPWTLPLSRWSCAHRGAQGCAPPSMLAVVAGLWAVGVQQCWQWGKAAGCSRWRQGDEARVGAGGTNMGTMAVKWWEVMGKGGELQDGLVQVHLEWQRPHILTMCGAQSDRDDRWQWEGAGATRVLQAFPVPIDAQRLKDNTGHLVTPGLTAPNLWTRHAEPLFNTHQCSTHSITGGQGAVVTPQSVPVPES